jgi:quercetin dioxygenase-like cupin family protein
MATTANWEKLSRVQVRGGVTRRVFSGKKSMMVLNELMPSAKPALHHHPHEQLTCIIEGTCKFVIGDEVVEMAEGDLILIPPDVPHSLEVTSNKPVLNLDVFSPIRDDYLGPGT